MSGSSVPVAAWACGQCSRVHRDQSEADDCCKCSGCGEKFHHENSYGSVCDRCEYGRNIRHARDAIVRAQEEWTRSHARLKALLEKPPPGKRRPRTPLPSPPPTKPVPYVHPDGREDSSAWSELYEVRDWLLDNDRNDLAAKVTRGIDRTGGGHPSISK